MSLIKKDKGKIFRNVESKRKLNKNKKFNENYIFLDKVRININVDCRVKKRNFINFFKVNGRLYVCLVNG